MGRERHFHSRASDVLSSRSARFVALRPMTIRLTCDREKYKVAKDVHEFASPNLGKCHRGQPL